MAATILLLTQVVADGFGVDLSPEMIALGHEYA
jgi:hypothetical protein